MKKCTTGQCGNTYPVSTTIQITEEPAQHFDNRRIRFRAYTRKGPFELALTKERALWLASELKKAAAKA